MFNQPTLEKIDIPRGTSIPAAYYDESYYAGLPKANWNKPYTWNNMKPTFAVWAAFLLSAFPEAESFLDVGCAKGFLERALIETIGINRRRSLEMTGFDFSEHAIANAEEKAKPFLECASVDDFKFKRDYDILISLDLFEHLTEKQVRSFLLRSREHINDCGFFCIATDNEMNRAEPSHITLQDYNWWNELFLDCGWILDDEMVEFRKVMLKNTFISNSYSEIFIYSSGKL